MRTEIIELEKILEEEIQAYSKIEAIITEKNDSLVKGDINKILKIDSELDKYNLAVEKLEEKRKQIYPENQTLSQIIEKIEEKNKAKGLNEKKEKLKELLTSVDKKNKANSELIKHSLRIIENSIMTIANALVPKSNSYNQKGKMYKQNINSVSSIVHEI